MPSTSYLDQNFKSSYYHEVRPTYPVTLINRILQYHDEYHHSHGGSRNLLLDVGCGTGIATSMFIPHFQKCVGVDPSESMLQVARQDYPRATFKLGYGEDLVSLDNLEKGTVDMVIGAESLHWCDMDIAFEQVYQLLKQGGTFAFWLYVQPEFVDLGPKANEIYYKYGWGPQYMGKYLTPEQRYFFTNMGGDDLPERLIKQKFKDLEVGENCSSNNQHSEPFLMKGQITLKDFKRFVKSWSLYTSWVKNHPDETNDIADVFIDELMKECNVPSEETLLNIEWSTFYYICRKK
ncbi:S-adenosylmethionine-dependent methyltransferase KNAG_0L02450 [Huiozyma naganishii CBS 8797]|uniref:Methyltransferase type 11 domain-containing protein n=1 Tax=Huiozyma naganishii (strain ATCC MYA-139 / BCRC 22969 / CBS 8797 / KCTC 17520 / NBRC 10181 / NCYC 3082 / Yp74L-3) TaxID=1071383 RepID=J7SAL9_HUIN7|nr:hypothetical protein KNAG_0L02450 [Kazachstania naganishii CBS 8797]CCK72859.1 hypothetical protein KNAG_0L02450 [Kazachstania naganishii CBS 8797]